MSLQQLLSVFVSFALARVCYTGVFRRIRGFDFSKDIACRGDGTSMAMLWKME